MRLLLTGATGLIGRAVLASLRGEGHAVVAVARNADAATRLPEAAGFIALDIAKATTPADWLPHLLGIDALVNCAGVCRTARATPTAGVHAEGAAALFAACEQAGVRRVVQISALGVDRGAATAFARTKLAGDEALMARDLDWAILRPSVVVGRQAYGGSALFRGLAALPILPRLADAGPLQLVQLDDLVRQCCFSFARRAEPPRPRDCGARATVARGGACRLSPLARAGGSALRYAARLAGSRRLSRGRSHRSPRLAAAAALHRRCANSRAAPSPIPHPGRASRGIEPRAL